MFSNKKNHLIPSRDCTILAKFEKVWNIESNNYIGRLSLRDVKNKLVTKEADIEGQKRRRKFHNLIQPRWLNCTF